VNKILSLLIAALFFSMPSWAEDVSKSAALEKATFAGGCFWCMESNMEKIPGVISVVSGYMSGDGTNPTYHDYSERGFIEVIEVAFDPKKITYPELLNHYWKQVDPLDGGGQFCDRGHAYTTGVFYYNEEQKQWAESSKQALDVSGVLSAAIVTPVVSAQAFYAAEEYHQDYYKKNPLKYKFYRLRCGRDQQIQKVWGKK
jgi:peptide methionine sulfoxide reductase msrA/msrB